MWDGAYKHTQCAHFACMSVSVLTSRLDKKKCSKKSNINQVFLYIFIMSWFLDHDCFNHKADCTKHMSLRLSNTFQSQLPLWSPVIACHFLCQIMTVDIQFGLCMYEILNNAQQFRWGWKHLAFQKTHTHKRADREGGGKNLKVIFSWTRMRRPADEACWYCSPASVHF